MKVLIVVERKKDRITATTAEIEEFLSSIKSVDESVTADVKWVKAVLPEYPKIKAFIEHCCQLRHYSFCIKPPRLPSDVFEEIKFLPDPVPNDDGHYKPFEFMAKRQVKNIALHFRNVLQDSKRCHSLLVSSMHETPT